jgi:hypothetical protein
VRTSQLAHQSDYRERGMIPESACGSKEFDLPFSRFPLRGQAGAGGFPPRRDTCRASKNRWHVPCGGSPHKRGCCPLVHPPLRFTFPVAFTGFAPRRFSLAYLREFKFDLAETRSAE